MADEIKPTESELTVRKAYNGGRKVTIGGRVTFDTINAYTPSWTKEYNEEFTTYDGRIIRFCKGIRFSLTFTVYGLTYEKLTQTYEIFKSDTISLECPEFSGDVTCDSLSPPVRYSNVYGTFYELTITLSAAALTDPDSGFL